MQYKINLHPQIIPLESNILVAVMATYFANNANMIDITTLGDFLVLCQVRSFSRAAERRHVSVSGLSRRIQGLEEWAGAPVFDRRKSSLELTEAGQRLQAVASEVVYALEGLRKSLRHEGEDKRLRVRFAAPHILSAICFHDWIPRLHSEFKSAKFSVISDNLPDCFAMLEDGSADFVAALFDHGGAVASRVAPQADLEALLSVELGRESLVPVSAPGADGKPLFDLARGDVAPVSFLGYDPDCHLGWALQARLRQADMPPLQQHHSASLTDGLRAMALARLGLAWLPLTLVRKDLDAGALVRAGGTRFDVPLRLRLFRKQETLAEQAELLYESLRTALTGRESAAQ